MNTDWGFGHSVYRHDLLKLIREIELLWVVWPRCIEWRYRHSIHGPAGKTSLAEWHSTEVYGFRHSIQIQEMSDVIRAITLTASYVTRQYDTTWTCGQYKIRSTHHITTWANDKHYLRNLRRLCLLILLILPLSLYFSKYKLNATSSRYTGSDSWMKETLFTFMSSAKKFSLLVSSLY